MLLCQNIAIVFEVWSYEATLFVGGFTTFRSNDDIGYGQALVAFSPLENKTS